MGVESIESSNDKFVEAVAEELTIPGVFDQEVVVNDSSEVIVDKVTDEQTIEHESDTTDTAKVDAETTKVDEMTTPATAVEISTLDSPVPTILATDITESADGAIIGDSVIGSTAAYSSLDVSDRDIASDSIEIADPSSLETADPSPLETADPSVASPRETSTAGPGDSTHNYSTRSKVIPTPSQLKQLAANVVIHPRLKPLPFKDFSNSQLSSTPVARINGEQFYLSEEHPLNKRGFKYKPCRPNRTFKSNLYSTTESAPFKARPSYFDRATGIIFDENIDKVSTLGGWRSVRCNTGIREGSYYFEFNIIKANDGSKAHARIGIARREASIDAPVGFDGYGYGLRDVHGEFMTLSRPKGSYIEGGFTTGDTIGLLVELPTIGAHRDSITSFCEEYKPSKIVKKRKKVQPVVDNTPFNTHANIIRDQIPIKYKNSLYYEQYEYTNNKIMDHLFNPVALFGERAVLQEDLVFDKIPKIPGSSVTLFKNGVEQPEKITDLYSFLPTTIENEDIHLYYNTTQQQNPSYRCSDDGSLGYYPVISVFQGGVVSLNPGPDFKFPCPKRGSQPSADETSERTKEVQSLSSRYQEGIVEEWYWDLVDEIEAEYLDGFD